MRPIEKIKSAEMIRGALLAELSAGMWKEKMPGTRVLAKSLGVSAPTVHEAMEQLVREGHLLSGGPRRAFRVNPHASTGRKSKNTILRRELLILSHEDISMLIDSSRQLIETLMRSMVSKGWSVRHQVVDYVHAKYPLKRWDQQIRVEAGTKVIALYGNQTLATWALRKNVAILFLGGNPGSCPVSSIAVLSSRMAEEAIKRLTDLGHKRIVLPLCDRSVSFAHKMREVTKQCIESNGDQYLPHYHNPGSSYAGPGIIRGILSKVFDMKPPTALILLDWKELVAAHCFLAEKNIRVPEDISLVMLSDVTGAEWFHPALCRFRFPLKKINTLMVNWLHGRSRTELRHLLSGTWVQGGTIGPAPADETTNPRSR